MKSTKSILKLFKAIIVKTKRKKNPSKKLLEKTVKLGFVFSPEVIYNYSEKELLKLIKIVQSEFGLTAKQMNSSFHKSWDKVKNAPIEQLVLEQIIHYITTYGFKNLGIFNNDTVYITKEKLDIPKLEKDLPLIVIKGYNKKELKDKLLKLSSGIALKTDTIECILSVFADLNIEPPDIDSIKNKEIKIALYKSMDLVPSSPVEFLRYVIYIATGSMLLIKSNATIAAIKESELKEVVKCLNIYEKNFGLEQLSEIFYRFKPIFLALRCNKKCRPIINKIRKLAKKHHAPMREDYLNTITRRIKNSKAVGKKELNSELNKVNIFRKIRLAYALKFRTKESKSILYKIRNGKGFATSFDFNKQKEAGKVLNVVLESIIKDVNKNVKGKKIFIPDNVKYTLPSTEKQFTGYLPSGTCISIDKDMVFGIHWKDVKDNTIDLDLSLCNLDGKIGWDSEYRTEDRSILFSGDITAAPKGASELFYIKRQHKNTYLMSVNYFNYNADIEVPFKILVAKEQVSYLKKNYTVNPNNVVGINKTTIDKKQKMLGLVVTTTNECRFYFTEASLGTSITSSVNDYTEHARKYLINFYENTISLNDILKKAGADIIDNKDKCDIDLSMESLEKDTILNLLKKEE